MVDLAATRVLELGIGDVLDLDLSQLRVDDAAISAHYRPLLQCGQNNCRPFQRRADPNSIAAARSSQSTLPRLEQRHGGTRFDTTVDASTSRLLQSAERVGDACAVRPIRLRAISDVAFLNMFRSPTHGARGVVKKRLLLLGIHLSE
jgi:hypothetical protein